MRKLALAALLAAVLGGCARRWEAPRLRTFQPAASVPPATLCGECHTDAFRSWRSSRHGDPGRMARIPVASLRECEACHTPSGEHLQDPEGASPPRIDTLSRSEQNTLCGKCHYSQEIFGRKAINPHDRHGLLTDAGLEGRSRQLTCLDCHDPHGGRAALLTTARALVCYRCHRTAIVTMGIFQPLNYLTLGKACQACHTVHGGSALSRWLRMGTGVCVVCHVTGVALVGEDGE